MITKYNEFVNEGLLYNWLTTPFDKNQLNAGVVLSCFSIMLWIGKAISKNFTVDVILVILCIILYLPIAELLTRQSLKGIYHFMRKKFLSNQINRDYKKAQELVEKYPDIENELNDIKNRMIYAVKTRKTEPVSRVFHDMYELKKEINQREDLSNFFEITQEERQRLKDREHAITQNDPLREEDWSEK